MEVIIKVALLFPVLAGKKKTNVIEAFTNGNTSPLSKRNFSYRKGPIFRATLLPNQWSHRELLGIK